MNKLEKLTLAQEFLHKELGTDWNDLCQVLYEHRILCAMLKFSDCLKNSNQQALVSGSCKVKTSAKPNPGNVSPPRPVKHKSRDT